MTGDVDLFGDPIPEPGIPLTLAAKPPTSQPDRNTSYGRRLTEAQRALAMQGINPLTGRRGPEGATCGTCTHRVIYTNNRKQYPKCDIGPVSHGPKTDVRAYWPACPNYDPKGDQP